jgi:fructose/tagatose bisphosphate aldolase
MSDIRDDFAPGVITGPEVKEVFALAKARGFALPAANVIGTKSSSTPTTAQRSCCRGSTACSTPARRTSPTHGKPLFSSHMLDLSEEPLQENLEICKRYLERMSRWA